MCIRDSASTGTYDASTSTDDASTGADDAVSSGVRVRSAGIPTSADVLVRVLPSTHAYASSIPGTSADAFQPYAPRHSPAHHAPGPTAADVDLGIRAEIEEVRSELVRTDALFDASSRGAFSHAHDTPVRGDVSHARDTPSRGDFNRDGSSRGVSSHRGHSRHEPSRRERSRQRSRSPKAEASHTSGSTHRQRSPVIGRGIREAVSNLKAPPGTEVDEPCTHCLPRHGLRVARSHYAHECACLLYTSPSPRD